jgi:hypothetical protein
MTCEPQKYLTQVLGASFFEVGKRDPSLHHQFNSPWVPSVVESHVLM